MPTGTDSSRSEERGWMKPTQLAAREGVTRVTVWRWVAKGVAKRDALGPRTGVRVRLVEERSE